MAKKRCYDRKFKKNRKSLKKVLTNKKSFGKIILADAPKKLPRESPQGRRGGGLEKKEP